MRSFYRLSLVLSTLLLSCSSSQAEHLKSPRARHQRAEILKRDEVPITYFEAGRNACGGLDSDSDFIVALNSAQYDGGAHCFEMIAITVDGQTAVAQITDECPSCQPGGLDLSQGLFLYFAPLSKGELYGTWSYMTTSSSTSAPSTSYVPSSTLATITSPSSSSSSLSSTITSSVSTSTATKFTVPTSTPQDPQIFSLVDLTVLELGVLLQASLKLDS